MECKNLVFIARSLDGYIADQNESLDWLNMIPNPDQLDMGYNKFIEGIDAIVMGRKTFDKVCSFDIPWPYSKPVFVVSNTLSKVPDQYAEAVKLIKGTPQEIIEAINNLGYKHLYIDGGSTLQQFLREDVIDELIISTIPILLGGGIPLFSDLPKHMEFEHVSSNLFLEQIVQNHYKRKR